MVPEYFRVTVENEGPSHKVTLEGELDLAVSAGLAAQIVGSTGSTVIVDLSGLTFISAAGITAILDARNRIEEQGHRLILHGAEGMVRKVFQIVELDWLLSDD
jgi:anti-sigma B factor antagonist